MTTNTTIDVITRDATGLLLATQEQLDIYWRGATFFNTIAAIALVVVIREYFVNKALRAHAVAPYIGQVIADVLWCAAYVPYHWANAIRGHLASQQWCLLVCYCACACITMSAMSGALITISTWDTIVSALRRRPPRLTMNIIIGCWVLSFAGGIAWAAGMDSRGHAGAYRGMYCFLTNQGYWDTGGVMFTTLIVASFTIQTFGYLTYKVVRANTIAPAAGSHIDASHASSTATVADPWNIIYRRTLLLLAVYFGSFTGNIILAPLNAARVDAPIAFEIIAGWLTKVKPTLDAIIIYNIPSVRRAREARRAARKVGVVAHDAHGHVQPALPGGDWSTRAAARASTTMAPHTTVGGGGGSVAIGMASSPNQPPHNAVHARDGGWTAPQTNTNQPNNEQSSHATAVAAPSSTSPILPPPTLVAVEPIPFASNNITASSEATL